MKRNIAITGSTGNMGKQVLIKILEIPEIDKIKLLIPHNNKKFKTIKKITKKYENRIIFIHGLLQDENAIKELVKDVDYVINMAAVIPPASDKYPQKAYDCNYLGVKNLVKNIEKIKDKQPKLIHISTVALYGNRTYKHPFVQVGDPLLFSPLDIYALTKARGEKEVLDSSIKTWTVIRQTAMIYKELMMQNISDGLMFHTPFNTFLEWASAEDSGKLIANIIKEDIKGNLNNDNFWKHIFNLGGGNKNQITGYQTLDIGFKLIGGSTKDFFKPNYNAVRNFHGCWFSDSLELDNMFHYINDNYEDYFKAIGDSHFYFKLAAHLPKKMIGGLVIKPLLKDNNAPTKWVKENDEARIKATFYSKEYYDSLGDKWGKFNLLDEGRGFDGETISLKEIQNNPQNYRLNYFYDSNKKLSDININDLINVASAHGGKLISKEFAKGEVYSLLEWENQDGIKFKSTPFTILKGGHWYNKSYEEIVWDFDRLAKKDKIYSQIWYDDHKRDEDVTYEFDQNYKSVLKKF